MHLALGKENAGSWANLYHHNLITNSLDYYGSFRITENGQAMFGINHASTYLVTVSDVRPKENVVSHSVSQGSVQTGSYVIEKGDTLSKIAFRYATTVSELMRKNSKIADANKIFAGDTIIIN